MTPPEQLPTDPGERRLIAYLEEVGENPPPTDEALARRVHRSARWQHAIRGPLEVVGHLSSALADGLALLLGGPRRSDR